MAFDLSMISTGTVDRPPRIVLVGVPKIGKSTFGASFPSAFVLPIKGEDGIDDISVPCYRDAAGIPIPISSWDELMDSFIPMFEDHPYEYIVIGPISNNILCISSSC